MPEIDDDEHTAAVRSCYGSGAAQPKSTSWTQRLGRPPKRAILLILIVMVALGAVVTIQRIRPTTPHLGPSLVAQFAEWMSANTKSNIQISRVSCLDPAAAGA